MAGRELCERRHEDAPTHRRALARCTPAASSGISGMKPFLVTMGDAVGIGPEIIVRAFERGALAQAIVVGDPAVLRRAGAPMTAVVEHPADLPTVPPGCLPVLAPPGLP